MADHYPTPQEYGIKTPFYLNARQYEQGFLYALKGKEFDEQTNRSLSFTKGFKMGSIVSDEIK